MRARARRARTHARGGQKTRAEGKKKGRKERKKAPKGTVFGKVRGKSCKKSRKWQGLLVGLITKEMEGPNLRAHQLQGGAPAQQHHHQQQWRLRVLGLVLSMAAMAAGKWQSSHQEVGKVSQAKVAAKVHTHIG